MKVLLVEDEPRVARIVAQGLRESDYTVDISPDGGAAIALAAAIRYDAVILDVRLPDRDGLSVCQHMRSTGSTVPVLMLTACDAVETRIAGLDSGADDYVTKPFDFSELLARLRAVIRRGHRPLAPLIVRVGPLALDTRARTAMLRRRALALTTREYALLEYLMLNADTLLGRAEIVEHVWDSSLDPLSNAVEVCVQRLRRKIDEPGRASLISTRRGEGYMLSAG